MKNHSSESLIISAESIVKSIAALFTLTALLSGCVSVQLPGGKSAKASNVVYQKPAGSFKSIDAENSDQAWQSSKSGNTLAYLSECQPAVESNLKTLEGESLSALTNSHVIKTDTKEYNGRESIYTLADGTVDGIPVSVALLVFKKNGCNFTMTYSGRRSMFSSEYSQFEAFKESFKVP